MPPAVLITDVRPIPPERWLASCDCQQYKVCRTVEAGWDWVLTHDCLEVNKEQ